MEKKHKKQNFNVKTFFAIIISFRGIVSLVCVQSPFPTSFQRHQGRNIHFFLGKLGMDTDMLEQMLKVELGNCIAKRAEEQKALQNGE